LAVPSHRRVGRCRLATAPHEQHDDHDEHDDATGDEAEHERRGPGRQCHTCRRDRLILRDDVVMRLAVDAERLSSSIRT